MSSRREVTSYRYFRPYDPSYSPIDSGVVRRKPKTGLIIFLIILALLIIVAVIVTIIILRRRAAAKKTA